MTNRKDGASLRSTLGETLRERGDWEFTLGTFTNNVASNPQRG